jgi:hypothetical protein
VTRYSVIKNVSSLRNRPGSLVQGMAFYGWTFDFNGSSAGYDWGYVYGHFNHCTYIDSGNVGNPVSGGNNYCGSPTLPPNSDIATRINCTCLTDGSAMTTDPVNWNEECGNVLPWLTSGEVCSDPMRYIGPGSTVYVRYVTRGCNWAEVRDPNQTPATGDWVFMATSAIPGLNCTTWGQAA